MRRFLAMSGLVAAAMGPAVRIDVRNPSIRPLKDYDAHVVLWYQLQELMAAHAIRLERQRTHKEERRLVREAAQRRDAPIAEAAEAKRLRKQQKRRAQ